MSVLFWLFGLGGLAIAFPLIFHLIRRQPQGQMPFSSLLFLKPTPPRISRRSRVDNWLLLLLRSLAIILIALAFMRPFLPDTATLLQDNTVPRRVAILVDVSASMQRDGVWQQAQTQVEQSVDSFDTVDQLALFTFAEQTQTLVDFESGVREGEDRNRTAVLQAIQATSPGWEKGQLSQALTSVANQLNMANETTDQSGLSQLQIVLISDMQEPDDLQQLQAFRWPESVKLELIQVGPTDAAPTTDARLSLVQANVDGELVPRLRVRNSARSQKAGFEVRWLSHQDPADSDFAEGSQPPLNLQVSPGQQQTVDLPEEYIRGMGHFRLTGDADPFANTFYAAGPESKRQRVLFLSEADPQDAGQSVFFLRLAIPRSPTVETIFESFTSAQPQWMESWNDQAETDSPKCVAIIVDRKLNEEEKRVIDQYVNSGGNLIVKLGNNENAGELASLAGVRVVGQWEPAEGKQDYLLLGEVDFQNRLMLPFSEPGFNDFTKIHFWKAAAVEPQDVAAEAEGTIETIAKFDNGLPAIWEFRPAGSKGQITGLAFDWQPEQSQFALSSKFVPFVKQLIADRSPLVPQPTHYWVAALMPLPDSEENGTWKVQSLTGSPMNIDVRQPGEQAAEGPAFTAGEPGLYQAEREGQPKRYYAVNVHPSEFADERLVEEHFVGFGVPLGRQPSRSEQKDQQRLKKDLELEESQKLWKYLVAGALVLLIAEMTVAGRKAVVMSEQSARPRAN